jgi:hypothetical protein
MFELYLSHTSAGEHSTDPRNQFHETALRDARIASDWHGAAASTAAAAKPSFASRIRAAFAGSSAATTDACSCPA